MWTQCEKSRGVGGQSDRPLRLPNGPARLASPQEINKVATGGEPPWATPSPPTTQISPPPTWVSVPISAFSQPVGLEVRVTDNMFKSSSFIFLGRNRRPNEINGLTFKSDRLLVSFAIWPRPIFFASADRIAAYSGEPSGSQRGGSISSGTGLVSFLGASRLRGELVVSGAS